MAHAHSHSHAHHHAQPGGMGHDDGHGRDPGRTDETRRANRRRLTWALVLAGSYMVAEAIGGWFTGSLALIADAGHMLSDTAALALALFAIWVAQRPPDKWRTFGHTRAEILAALVQGVALVVVALLVVGEAIERLQEPTEVAAPGMLLIAGGGLAVNLLALWILEGGRHDSLNVRGAWLHVMSDALGSVGAIAAGLAIWTRGWTWADPVASLVICVLIAISAWHLLREAVDVLMETAPRHLDVEEIQRTLAEAPGILEVHDLHVWVIGSNEVSLSSHVVAESDADPDRILRLLHDTLLQRFGIEHATIQIETPEFLRDIHEASSSSAEIGDDPEASETHF